jgi:hypothetical protein
MAFDPAQLANFINPISNLVGGNNPQQSQTPAPVPQYESGQGDGSSAVTPQQSNPLASTATGALQGAGAGAMFGAPGAVIGGLVGGLGGLLTGRK